MKNEVIKKLRVLMDRQEADWFAAFTSDPHGSEYMSDHYRVVEHISGFSGENGALLIGHESAFLWTDSRFFIQAAKETDPEVISLMRYGEQGVPAFEDFLEEKIRGGECIAVNLSCTSEKTRGFFEKLCDEKKIHLTAAEGMINEIWPDRPEVCANAVRVEEDGAFGGSTSEKLEKVRALMKRRNIECLDIKALDQVMWLFNITGSDIPYNPLAYGYGRVTMDEAMIYLYENAFTDELKFHLGKSNVLLRRYGEFDGSGTCDKELIDGLKSAKTTEQIENIRRYFLYDSAAIIRFLFQLENEVEQGIVTERLAADLLHVERQKIAGFSGESFPTISAYGPNAAMAHYTPDRQRSVAIEKKGLYLCDSGGLYPGVTTDCTRTLAMGTLTQEEKKAYTLVAAGWAHLMGTVFREGCCGSNLDVMARNRMWKLGMDFGHGTGHGVGAGLCVHEGPQSIRWRSAEKGDIPLKAGMLVTDEPGYYEEGAFGFRIENTLLVTESAYEGFLCFEPLTLVPIDRRAIDMALLWDEEVGLINDYHALVFEKMSPFFKGEIRDWLEEACAPLS